MTDLQTDPPSDRLVLVLDPGGPMELGGLGDSMAALARLYERYYRPPDDDNPPKLFITKLQTGSVIAEIAPFVLLLGQTYPYIAAANTVLTFNKRVIDGIKAFAGFGPVSGPVVSAADASDLRAFITPLTGKRGASLGVRHARFSKITMGEEIVAEYIFDESAINRAAINMDRQIESDIPSDEAQTSRTVTEVMLIFDRASRAPGKDQGRTTDWTIVPEISPKARPTYFRKSIRGNLKDVMVRGDVNPLGKDIGFIVDVHAQLIGGEPKAYIVTEFHTTVPLEDDDG